MIGHDDIIWPEMPFGLDRLELVARVGSHSHGTYIPPEDPDSIDDQDIVGVAIPPARYYLGISRWENASSFQGPWDVVVYEYRKVVRLMMKQNPNVLCLLWLDPEDYLHVGPAWRLLIDHRGLFRHRDGALNAFFGYATAQLRKMIKGAHKGYMGEKRKALVSRYGYDIKNAAHLVRLLHMGIEYLRDGTLAVRRTWDRDLLVEIKTGGWSLEKVQRYAGEKEQEMRAAHQNSVLPEEIDRDAIEEFVVDSLKKRLGDRHLGLPFGREISEEERAWLSKGQIVLAVKSYRARTGVDLRTALDLLKTIRVAVEGQQSR